MSNPHPSICPRTCTPVLGDPHQMLVLRRARRVAGISAIEVSEVFQVSKVAAWRYLRRLEKKGLIYRTNEWRHRIEMFGRRWSRGVNIYRATGKEESLWAGSPSLRRRTSSRARCR